MDNFLQVNESSLNLPGSPTNSFIADETASFRPLITPPTNDLINPDSERVAPHFTIGGELVTILQHVQENNTDAGLDSGSSSSSALAEPACTLLNHHNYHHITATEPEPESDPPKAPPLQMTFRNPPDYFFMSWNWPLIRKLLLWLFLSGLIAMLALVIAMISSLPKTCNPPVEWYQGSVLYEIFPASFTDSDQDMIGDFRGLGKRIDYIKRLGVRGVRLNSIFATPHYPEDYRNVTTLMKVAPCLGTIDDFDQLVKRLHSANLTVMLDLLIQPIIGSLGVKASNVGNGTNLEPSVEFLRVNPSGLVDEALHFWVSHKVDGFYLKSVENLTADPNFTPTLRNWKKIIGQNRALIVSHLVVEQTPPQHQATLLANVDLVEVRLELEEGVEAVSKQLERLQNGTLFSKAGMPWILWSLSDDGTNRLAGILPHGNGTLGATLLQLMLPGTVSLFYGNEIGLGQVQKHDDDDGNVRHLNQLGAMVWLNETKKTISWNEGKATFSSFEQAALIGRMIALRGDSPSIYVNAIVKEGDNKANAEVKYSRSDLLVVQRWYPRRKSYVVVSNMGSGHVTADLSTLLYSGLVVIGPKADSKPGSVSFKKISLWPGESVVIMLD